MRTTEDTRIENRTSTPVAALPPLNVVVQGIPAAELLDSATTHDERRTHWFAWALAGVIGFALIVGGLLLSGAVRVAEEATAGHLGLTEQAWVDYRAGERAGVVVAGHMGLTPQAWVDVRGGERAA